MVIKVALLVVVVVVECKVLTSEQYFLSKIADFYQLLIKI